MLLNQRYEYDNKTDLLGIGGFGRVYRAWDLLLQRHVALKVVSLEGNALQYNLISEVQKSIVLQHANVVRYYDALVLKEETLTGERETQVGVMEYIPDGDISQLEWLLLPPNQQKDILLQILDGLGYLHQNKIIHRDIKPANILIKKEDGRIIPKITDFGISKAQDTVSVSVSRVIGSIPYMAPEQFDSKGRVSYNTDFWSLGVLVYKLFTGKMPFGDDSTTSEGVIMKNIMEMPLPQDVDKIPAPFRYLVELCLEKDRKLRIKDTGALRNVFLWQKPDEEPKNKELLEDKPTENLEIEEPDEETKVFEKPVHQKTNSVSVKKVAKPERRAHKLNISGRSIPLALIAAIVVSVLVFLLASQQKRGKQPVTPGELALYNDSIPVSGDIYAEISSDQNDTANQDEQAWQIARNENTIASYDNYLRVYPNGTYPAQARTNRSNLESVAREADATEREEQAWQTAIRSNTIASYDIYLRAYPNGQFVNQANTNKNNLEALAREEAARRADPFHDQMVFVRGGTFIMGCTEEQGGDCFDDEKPSHQVTLNNYYIGKFPVTQKQWRQLMGNNPSHFSDCDNCPVENVSWNDVQEFIRRLNSQSGKNYRLPTEAEWEYAARGGNNNNLFKYAGSNSAGDNGWFRENSRGRTQAVGGRQPNGLALFDMSGNVYEWCNDRYSTYTPDSKQNPRGPSAGSRRVIRGGSWNDGAERCRVSARANSNPNNGNLYIGFRLARD